MKNDLKQLLFDAGISMTKDNFESLYLSFANLVNKKINDCASSIPIYKPTISLDEKTKDKYFFYPGDGSTLALNEKEFDLVMSVCNQKSNTIKNNYKI